MVSKTVSSLGFDLSVNVPDTVEAYDTLAKKQGACLESAVLNVLYRSVFAKFRSAFADAVENNTGITRETEAVLGKDGQPKIDEETKEPVTRYTETEDKYFKRACAELVKDGQFESVEAAAASFLSLAQSTIAGIAFDPSESERQPSGPKKIAKAYITLATQAQEKGKLDTLASQLQDKLGATWKVEATVDSVARAISEDQRRKREAQTLAGEYNV